jgi:predicted DNA-binding transcriptional regulator AlpA
MFALLRFADLKKRGVATSWAQLKRLQETQAFPAGKMLSPNARAWPEEEVDAWWKSRPTKNGRPLQGTAKARHERRQAAADQTP